MGDVYVRNNSGEAVDQAANLDVLVVAGNKFALIHFENDEVGTQTEDPRGSGAGVAVGSLGRVGGIMTAEFAGSFDTVSTPPVAPGKGVGMVEVRGDSATVKDAGAASGSYQKLSAGQRLPSALRQYTSKIDFASLPF